MGTTTKMCRGGINLAVFDSLINELIEKLSSVPSLSDIKFRSAYDNIAKPNPSLCITAVFGFGGIKINNCAFGDFFGANTQQELYSKKSEFTVNFEICTPQKLTGKSGVEAFDRICEALLFDQSVNERAVSIEAEEQVYDAKSFAFIIKGKLKFNFAISREIDETAISNIVVRGVYS